MYMIVQSVLSPPLWSRTVAVVVGVGDGGGSSSSSSSWWWWWWWWW